MKKRILFIMIMCLTFSMSGCVCDSKKEDTGVDQAVSADVEDKSVETEDEIESDKDTEEPTADESVDQNEENDSESETETTKNNQSGSSESTKNSTSTSTSKSNQTGTSTVTPSATVVPTATPIPTVTPVPTVTPEQTITPVPTVTPEPTVTPAPEVTPQIPGIVEAGVAVDDAGLLTYVPNETVEKNSMQDMYLLQDKLVLGNYSYDSSTQTVSRVFETISMETGEVVNSVKIPDVSTARVQICGDKMVLCKADTGEVYILNDALEQEKICSVLACDNIFVNTAVTEAYCFTKSGIHVYDLTSGTEKKVLLSDTCKLVITNYNDYGVGIVYVKPENELYYSAGLDLNTGELELLELEVAYEDADYAACNWFASTTQTGNTYVLGEQSELKTFDSPIETAYFCLVGTAPHLLMRSYSDTGIWELALYDMDGTFISSVTFEEDMWGVMAGPLWCESAGGYFFTSMNNDTGNDCLYFWDISTETSGEDLELVAWNQEEDLKGEVLPEEYYERAAKLSEKYGITIKIGDQCRTDNDYSKTVEQELDPGVIETGLAVLEEVLDSFPANLLSQLRYGYVRGIEINLMGKITDKDPIPGHNPVGYVIDEGGKSIMVLNIHIPYNGTGTVEDSISSLKSVIYHETGHLIDFKMEFHADIVGDASVYSLEKWDALNPESFEYTESYDTTSSQYWDYTSYFIDEYSTTYAKEDRARVFEYAASQKSIYFNTTGFLGCNEKLSYFCKCIRDTFDTTDWPDETLWEWSLHHANDGISPDAKG